MPNPSAISKFVLGTLKFFKHTQFLKYTQNVLSILKWSNLCSKISLLSIPKTFWVYFKNWACLKNLSVLKTNFEIADGLGNRCQDASWNKCGFRQIESFKLSLF